MKFQRLLHIVFLLVFVTNSFAQQKGFVLKNFTQEDGLPSNETYFVFEDSKHYLWFATDKGVVRFNGKSMQQFDLPDKVIFKIHEDKKGRIWFFSYSGKLAYFYDNKIYPYKYNELIYHKIGGFGINEAFIHDDESITITPKGAGYNFFISKEGVFTQTTYGQRELPNSFKCIIKQMSEKFAMMLIKDINEVKPGPLFIYLETYTKKIIIQTNEQVLWPSSYGCKMVDKNNYLLFYKNKLVKVNTRGEYQIQTLDADIISLELGNGLLYAGTYNGVRVLDLSMNFLYKMSNLADLTISSIQKDYEGGMWFSTTEKGIFYLKNPGIYYEDDEKIKNYPNYRLSVLNDSALISGNANGIYSIEKNKVKTVLNFHFTNMADLLIDDHNNLIIGSGNTKGRFTSVNNMVMYSPVIGKQIVDFTSFAEIACTEKNYYFIDGQTFFKTSRSDLRIKNLELKNIHVKSTFVDHNNDVWLTNLNGIYKCDFTNHKAIPIKPDDPFFNNGVTCMRQMDNGMYVLGTRFNGILLMQDTVVTGRITTTEGLMNNAVTYLLKKGNQLWVATASGVSVIQFSNSNPLKYTITNIGKSTGFYNFVIHQLEPFQNNIVAATSQGVYYIENPDLFLQTPPAPLFFYVNAVHYKGIDTTSLKSFTIPYSQNRLKINYGAICFNSPDEVKYFFRFPEKDSAWQITTGNELILDNLAWGQYHLQIKAGIPEQKRFSEVVSFRFTVSPPWYFSPAFLTLFVLLCVIFIFIILKYRIKKLNRKSEASIALNKRIAELQQTALRSQINPHFIFNCLTSIQQLILSGNSLDANEYLVKFSRLIRKTLELSSSPYIRITEEVNYLKEYLTLEQLRLPGQFEYVIEIDSGINTETTEIPNMMLQPIIENCVRHGIKSMQEKKGMIRIIMEPAGKSISCTVTDNGVGRNYTSTFTKSAFSQHKSFGMEIVNKRLEILAETEQKEVTMTTHDLKHADGTSAGTEVVILLPFKMNTI